MIKEQIELATRIRNGWLKEGYPYLAKLWDGIIKRLENELKEQP